jgi:hypothetical protein
MMVEFAGLPGSGKSYLAEALNYSLSAEGCRVSMPGLRLSRLPSVLRLPAKMYCSVALCLRSPAKAHAVWKAIGRPGETGTAARIKLFIACALPLFWYGRQSDRNGILVMDQGSVQALASAAFRNDPANLDALAALLPAPDILVIVAAAEKDINSRLASGRVGGASRAEDPAGRADYARALGWALSVPGGPAVRAARRVELVNDGVGAAEATLAPLVRSINEARS